MPQGISLHIGLDDISQDHYLDFFPSLKGPEYDAGDMETIAKNMGFHTNVLLTAAATRSRVLNEIRNAGNILIAGDIFLLTFSGHGSNLPGGEDETDRVDETWCMYDGQISDDVLFQHYCRFKEGVRILVVSDSCHSGTLLSFHEDGRPLNKISCHKELSEQAAHDTYISNKTFYDGIRKEVPKKNAADLKASAKLLSACRDDQEAEAADDGRYNSLFTHGLKKVWQQGSFNNYQQFHNQLLLHFSGFPEQTPQYKLLGKPNAAYNNQRPFTI